MKIFFAAISIAFATASGSGGAAPLPSAAAATSQPVVVESYYRAKWGGGEEFKRLYVKNEQRLLREMQRLGFIKALRFDQQFTHMPGGARWDLRATIVYRDAPSAVESNGAFEQAFDDARVRLIPDKAAYDAEEARRFSLLDDHWDIVVSPITEK